MCIEFVNIVTRPNPLSLVRDVFCSSYEFGIKSISCPLSSYSDRAVSAVMFETCTVLFECTRKLLSSVGFAKRARSIAQQTFALRDHFHLDTCFEM